MNINIGDAVVIRGTVKSFGSTWVNIETPGPYSLLYVLRDRITEVIPKPKVPKVGEIWEGKKAPTSKRKVYYVDDTYVVYEDISHSGNVYKKAINYFLDHFRPET